MVFFSFPVITDGQSFDRIAGSQERNALIVSEEKTQESFTDRDIPAGNETAALRGL